MAVQAMLNAALSEHRVIPRTNASLPPSLVTGPAADIVDDLYREDTRLYARIRSSRLRLLRTPLFHARHDPADRAAEGYCRGVS